jgi:hypothetical protein
MAGQPALVRVRMPDRPGALGLVASRIGALKADIVGIEIRDRIDGVALDEVTVLLPEPGLEAALTREIQEVDGATVESLELIDALPEPRLDSWFAATRIVQARDDGDLAEALASAVAECVATWCAVQLDAALSVVGEPSNPGAGGTTDLATLERLAVHRRPVGRGLLLVGGSRPLHANEQARIDACCGLVEALLAARRR